MAEIRAMRRLPPRIASGVYHALCVSPKRRRRWALRPATVAASQEEPLNHLQRASALYLPATPYPRRCSPTVTSPATALLPVPRPRHSARLLRFGDISCAMPGTLSATSILLKPSVSPRSLRWAVHLLTCTKAHVGMFAAGKRPVEASRAQAFD